jgi:hypothetical protein
MPDFSWMAAEERLSPAALTVQAQAVDPTDRGLLLWDIFFPRRNVDQTKLSSLTTQQVRISADRREWNARGRYVNLVTPPSKELEWVPIESYFRIEEKEINDLLNEVRGNQALFRQIIGARIPDRTNQLVMANYRRLELDVMEAWALGQITSMNPQTGQTFVVDYGFDANRYQTAGTAWNDVGTNAFNNFVAWLEDAYEAVGPYTGAMMRLASRNAIVADAPNPLPGVATGIGATVTQTEQRIQDQTGRPFRFMVNENTVQTFTDAGITRQNVKVWPAEQIAIVPAGNRIGSTAFAPVSRAYDISDQVPNAGVDIRGVTVYHEAGNMGRDLTVEAQFNPMPDPDEANLYVIDVGV